MPETSVTLETVGDVAVVRFDDGRANVLNLATIAGLQGALDEALDTAGAVAVVGRPDRFSAGFDLAVMNGDDPAAVQELVRAGAELALRLYMHPQPVVAACTGHAIAMAAILLMAVDVRHGASGDYKIGTNETAIGMSFPRFGIALARDRLSRRHLQAAIQQARLYDPPGAMDAGFLDSVHPPEQVERAAVDHAQVLAETLHRGAFRVTRERLRGDIAREAAAGLELDIDEIGAARRR